MFIEWNFLLAEIWGLLVLAALVGLIAGWIIWGRHNDVEAEANAEDVRRLRAELVRMKTQKSAAIVSAQDDVPAMQGGGYARPAAPVAKSPPREVTPATAPPAAPPKGITPSPNKPQGLVEARDGIPDDLTKIKGIGAKMEKLCNSLGFWHFDQIAAWSVDEIAWVDANLEGFKGRVSRDGWVDQARALAPEPTFKRRKD